MNKYDILICIKGMFGIVLLVLILLFINPYQDYMLASTGMMLAIGLLGWCIGYGIMHLLVHTRMITFDQPHTQGFYAYIFGLLFAVWCICAVLMIFLYHFTWFAWLWIGLIFVFICAIYYLILPPQVEDVY